jgi:hypothetical protein
MDGTMTTNICFGGPGHEDRVHHAVMDRKAVRVDWPTPGLKLNQAG